jgi:hypothetical protein
VVRPTIHGNDAAKEPGGVHAITEKAGNLNLEVKSQNSEVGMSRF